MDNMAPQRLFQRMEAHFECFIRTFLEKLSLGHKILNKTLMLLIEVSD